jgi:hypothetical protein|tara:strand:+ start:617 stop:736 length:120 start_codon:yes stop_codon:yes gene_type:complete
METTIAMFAGIIVGAIGMSLLKKTKPFFTISIRIFERYG